MIVLSVIGVAAPAPPPDGSARRRALNVAMSLIVVPLAVYLASYVSFFVQQWPHVAQFLSLQGAMFHSQWHYAHMQVESSAPISWLIPSAMSGTTPPAGRSCWSGTRCCGGASWPPFPSWSIPEFPG